MARSLRSVLNDLTEAFVDDVLNVIGTATPVEIVGETAPAPKKRSVGLPLLVRRETRKWANEYGLSQAQADVLERVALGETTNSVATARGSTGATIKKHAFNLLRRTGDKTLHLAVARLLRDVARSKIG